MKWASTENNYFQALWIEDQTYREPFHNMDEKMYAWGTFIVLEFCIQKKSKNLVQLMQFSISVQNINMYMTIILKRKQIQCIPRGENRIARHKCISMCIPEFKSTQKMLVYINGSGWGNTMHNCKIHFFVSFYNIQWLIILAIGFNIWKIEWFDTLWNLM